MARPIKIPDNQKPKDSFVMIGVYPKTRIRIKKKAAKYGMPIYEYLDKVSKTIDL